MAGAASRAGLVVGIVFLVFLILLYWTTSSASWNEGPLPQRQLVPDDYPAEATPHPAAGRSITSGLLTDSPPVTSSSVDRSETVPAARRPIGPLYGNESRVAGGKGKYLMFNPLYQWYGLTNQLMCYSAALRYGLESGRWVVFPEAGMAANSTFYQLFDREATQQKLQDRFLHFQDPSHGGKSRQQLAVRREKGLGGEIMRFPVISRLSEVPKEFLPPVSMNKKNLFLPKRTVFHSTRFAQHSITHLQSIIGKSSAYPAVRHHNFFMRFPWVGDMAPFDEGGIMVSLVFTKSVRDHAACIVQSLLPVRYVAVHLRIETDAKLIRPTGAVDPSAGQILSFLRGDALRLAQESQSQGIYLCTGAIAPALRQALSSWDDPFIPIFIRGDGFRVFGGPKPRDGGSGSSLNRQEVARGRNCSVIAPLPSVVGAQREAHQAAGVKTTQDHFGAAVDLSVMQTAQVALLPDYSTFRIAVFARRCDEFGVGGAQANTSPSSLLPMASDGIWVYKVQDKGQFERAVQLPCSGKASGWAGHRSWEAA